MTPKKNYHTRSIRLILRSIKKLQQRIDAINIKSRLQRFSSNLSSTPKRQRALLRIQNTLIATKNWFTQSIPAVTVAQVGLCYIIQPKLIFRLITKEKWSSADTIGWLSLIALYTKHAIESHPSMEKPTNQPDPSTDYICSKIQFDIFDPKVMQRRGVKKIVNCPEKDCIHDQVISTPKKKQSLLQEMSKWVDTAIKLPLLILHGSFEACISMHGIEMQHCHGHQHSHHHSSNHLQVLITGFFSGISECVGEYSSIFSTPLIPEHWRNKSVIGTSSADEDNEQEEVDPFTCFPVNGEYTSARSISQHRRNKPDLYTSRASRHDPQKDGDQFFCFPADDDISATNQNTPKLKPTPQSSSTHRRGKYLRHRQVQIKTGKPSKPPRSTKPAHMKIRRALRSTRPIRSLPTQSTRQHSHPIKNTHPWFSKLDNFVKKYHIEAMVCAFASLAFGLFSYQVLSEHIDLLLGGITVNSQLLFLLQLTFAAAYALSHGKKIENFYTCITNHDASENSPRYGFILAYIFTSFATARGLYFEFSGHIMELIPAQKLAKALALTASGLWAYVLYQAGINGESACCSNEEGTSTGIISQLEQNIESLYEKLSKRTTIPLPQLKLSTLHESIAITTCGLIAGIELCEFVAPLGLGIKTMRTFIMLSVLSAIYVDSAFLSTNTNDTGPTEQLVSALYSLKLGQFLQNCGKWMKNLASYCYQHRILAMRKTLTIPNKQLMAVLSEWIPRSSHSDKKMPYQSQSSGFKQFTSALLGLQR